MMAQAQYGFFGGELDAGGQIKLALGGPRAQRTGWASEEPAESSVDRLQPFMEIEIVHVEPEGAVGFQADEMFEYGLRVNRSSIGRQPHHLVFGAVDPEAQVLGKSGIKETN